MSFLVAQWVKDPALSPLWLGWLLWCGIDPWLGNFHMTWDQPKKKVLVLNAKCFICLSFNLHNILYRNVEYILPCIIIVLILQMRKLRFTEFTSLA